MAGRKVVVAAMVSANGEVCVRGEVVAVRLPESWMAKLAGREDLEGDKDK